MRDIATLTADELRNLAIDFEHNWTDRARALCELHRRAKANAELWDEVEVVLLYLPRDASHGVVPAFTFETLRQALASAKAATGVQ